MKEPILNIDQAIRALVMGQQRILSLVVQVDPSAECYTGWNVRDVVAHLVGWDEVALTIAKDLAGISHAHIGKIDSIDTYNAQSTKKREHLELKICVEEYVSTRRELLGTIAQLDPTKFHKVVNLPWGGEGTLLEVLDTWVEHEEQHRADLMACLKGK